MITLTAIVLALGLGCAVIRLWDAIAAAEVPAEIAAEPAARQV
jgi:hypothetical protein